MGVIKPLNGSFKWIDTANISYFEQEFTYTQDTTAVDLCFDLLENMDKKLGIHLTCKVWCFKRHG